MNAGLGTGLDTGLETGPAVDVVIINFNAGGALLRCLRSVLEEPLPLRVAVVDNASTDDSFDGLSDLYGGDERLSLVRNPDNPGFAAAVNRFLAEQAHRPWAGDKARALLLLNPDCELQAGALPLLLEALDSDPQAALAAPLVVDEQGQPQRGNLRRFPDPWRSLMQFSGLWRLGRRFPLLRGVEQRGDSAAGTRRAEAVSGACMLIDREVFDGLGGMDPDYGLHCEDLDLMYRLRREGYHSLYVPGARACHQQGVSSSSRPLWVHWQKHLGMQRFFLKFQASGHAWPLRWLVLAGIWLRFALTLPLAVLRR